MTQLGLVFDPPRARVYDPVESHQAAARAKEFQVAHCCLILGALREGPAGVDEIARRVRMERQQVNKRLPELQRAGAVVLTGHTVPSQSGRAQREWALKT